MRRSLLLLVASAIVADAWAAGGPPRKPRRAALLSMNLLDALNPFGKKDFGPNVVMGTEEMMAPKAHGTSDTPVQKNLRWGCRSDIADNICNFNRHYAERGTYWERSTTFLREEEQTEGPIEFYDSNTGELLFKAPIGRSWDQFVRESRVHGWPSFRDAEVDWTHVRVLPNGECISDAGTHLGHNLPDGSGNRYCINLVSVAGRPGKQHPRHGE
jgi:peptide methionine sulfoxide reductase MsrB